MQTLEQALKAWPDKITIAMIENISTFLHAKEEKIRSITWHMIDDLVYFVTEYEGDTFTCDRYGTIQMFKKG